MIVEYWFRVSVKSEISIQDVAKVVAEFARMYERFDASLSHKEMKIENEGQLIYPASKSTLASAFGTMMVTPGNKYHWKLKVIGDDIKGINIGIIESQECSKSKSDYWWCKEYGFSYHSKNGWLYHRVITDGSLRGSSKQYGDRYGDNDVIDIWLDLKDKYELSFSKNNKDMGKASDVKKETDYKLAVGIRISNKDNPTKIELLSCDIVCDRL